MMQAGASTQRTQSSFYSVANGGQGVGKPIRPGCVGAEASLPERLITCRKEQSCISAAEPQGGHMYVLGSALVYLPRDSGSSRRQPERARTSGLTALGIKLRYPTTSFACQQNRHWNAAVKSAQLVDLSEELRRCSARRIGLGHEVYKHEK